MAENGNGAGTPVTLFVSPQGPSPVATATPTVTVPPPLPRPHLPFTGFDLSTALVLTALLLSVGLVFLASGRRPAPHFRRT